MRKFFIHFLIISVIFFALGCSSLTRYPDVTQEARENFENGNFQAALDKYKEGLEDTSDGLCYKLESGLVAHTAANYDKSIEYFADAERRMDEFRDRAKVSASSVGEEAGSAFLNEKVIPYKGEFFERTLLHTYQALNYLLLGKTEDARAEIKRAELSQQEAQDEYAQELEESKKEATQDKNPELTSNLQAEVEKNYRVPDEYLNDKSNIYQIASTFYLASLVYEIMGEYNDSYIDLKKLYEINPGFTYGVIDLSYKAAKAGFSEEAHSWQAKVPGLPALDPNMGSVVVFFQCDRGPFKQEVSFYIPTGVGFQKIAWPVYNVAQKVGGSLELLVGSQSYSTMPLTDINSVAIRYHKDKSTVRAVRMGVRLGVKIASQYAAKIAVDKAAGNNWGWVASIGTSIVTSITEQADERSWMTLPRNIQFLRAYLPAGEYDASLVLKSSNSSTMATESIGKIKVFPKKITFITARSVHNRLFYGMKNTGKKGNL